MPLSLANAQVEKLLKMAGAERVSADAIAYLNELLVNYGLEISKYAIEIAKHAGRKTVQGGDIKLAAENMSK